MPGITIRRRLAAANPRQRQRRFYLGLLALPFLIVVAVLAAAFGGGQAGMTQRPDLSLGTSGVTCATAHGTAISFRSAVTKAKQAPPDYSEVTAYGFKAPINPSEIKGFRLTLDARLAAVDTKAKSAAQGTCTDANTATIVDADGKTKTLAVVDGDQPMTPVSGSEANRDPRTVPVTVGTDGDKTRTNTWAELNTLYGKTKWYTDCTNTNIAMDWDKDIPKYKATEGGHDLRFIVAINTSKSITDDQLRTRAAEDGNPDTSKLEVVRYDTIINTRNLEDNRCDPFIHTKSQVRVSLGKAIYDEHGKFKELDKTQGVFVDCHNMWRLPKSKPVPTPTPSTSKPPTTTTSTPPPSTPPTSKPPQKCVPPKVENRDGDCVTPKDPSDGDGREDIPDQVKGSHPPATKEPRPSSPPETYVPPPPPANNGGGQTSQPQPTRTSTPPRDTPAPDETDPAQPGGGCAPGIPSC
ncbi:MAG TPA: hypothetical protein VJM46_00835 [Candidatus Saccharimonadales bacterium]|nr:hypothetical protein [Candidatus Saccharimonadales bacterium]